MEETTEGNKLISKKIKMDYIQSVGDKRMLSRRYFQHIFFGYFEIEFEWLFLVAYLLHNLFWLLNSKL